MNTALWNRIVNVFSETYRHHTGIDTVPSLTDDTVLFETGLDSLGFAILVVQLEQELGYDPFVMCELPYYPRTFGELVRFYDANAPQ